MFWLDLIKKKQNQQWIDPTYKYCLCLRSLFLNPSQHTRHNERWLTSSIIKMNMSTWVFFCAHPTIQLLETLTGALSVYINVRLKAQQIHSLLLFDMTY